MVILYGNPIDHKCVLYLCTLHGAAFLNTGEQQWHVYREWSARGICLKILSYLQPTLQINDARETAEAVFLKKRE